MRRLRAGVWALGLGLCLALCVAEPTWAEALALKPGEQSAGVLNWSEAEHQARFGHMDRVFTTRIVPAGLHVRPLRRGRAINPKIVMDGQVLSLEAFMAAQHVEGLLVLKDGRIRLERYGPDLKADVRWTSFSVAKSVTSTLVGAALKAGAIRSLEDPVAYYLPDLRGSGYDGVSVRQVLSMTSGVAWNEDYTDPNSDVARLFNQGPAEGPDEAGMDLTVRYMRHLKRQSEPGTQWVYKTGETNLVGALVRAATHKSLAQYLSEKIWRPYGMEAEANWMIDSHGAEAGGCCLSMRLRDYGRFGLFLLEGGVAAGRHVVPEGWFAEATSKQADIGDPDTGYGYQWWTEASGSFDGYGIFGQCLHIDPKRRLVIVILSAWPEPVSRARSKARATLIAAVTEAVMP